MPYSLALVYAVVALSLAEAAGVSATKLPACPRSGVTLSSRDVVICQEALKRLHALSDCQGPLEERCCSEIDRLTKHSCHCWAGVTASQRHDLEGLYSPCARGKLAEAQQQSGYRARLFVGVLTAGQNARARQAIRDTWGADTRLHRVLFFSAKPRDEAEFDALRNEAAAKGDVVVLPTIWESYYNITHQTLEVMRASALDGGATHTLKADDDSYVRVDDVLGKIEAAPASRMFMGFIENPGGGPHRDPSSQWHVTPEEWPSERYPPWAHGAGYVISQDLVREIAAGAALKAQAHQVFKLEDIAVGSWVEFVGRDRGWDINYVVDQAFNYAGCRGTDAVSHYIKPRNMRCMFKSGGACCSTSSVTQHLRGGGV